MKKRLLSAAAMLAISSVAYAGNNTITVFQDPNCGCCDGWSQHMQDAGFKIKSIKTGNMTAVKEKLGVPLNLASCHTAVVEGTGQIIEGHVPAAAVHKMLANASVKGVAAPGMPLNSPGMGAMDGNLVTVDFNGQPFSKD
ncbi:CopG family transcriptional regulator [Advenella sp. WQ 585]|uniref:CopG family transcriptional regulator n=1 Tax=Advenella mandrilli TaxID=2800330 RepID=A0ABS1ECD4_9BURK|nr:DUF411 domain-containing protein [Advenella mandrilli]MBK1781251.1 CopG family transcriptional regulator [Advenella mandrilli]